MNFIIVNGKIVSKKETNLTDFIWGNTITISQKIWFGYGGIPLLHENMESVEQQLATFNRTLPDFFKNKRELFRLSKRMLNKNKFYRSGYIHFQLFISQHKIHSVISSTAVSEFDFPINEEGLLVTITPGLKNSNSNLGKYKCHNQLLWESVKAQIQNSVYRNSIILNEKRMVCEGIGTNIFMIKDKAIIAPSLKTGCYNDILRNIVLQLAKSMHLRIVETDQITKNHLLEMDELFFVNEEHGVQWILGIGDKRFVHEYSSKLHQQLNNYLEASVKK